MLGKIKEINNNNLIIEYQENQELNLLNHFVKIGNNIIGEIINISENLITIKLLGEIINQEFSYGVLKKPSLKETVSLIDDNNLKIILNTLNYQEEKDLILGINPIYNQEVTIKINPACCPDIFFLVHVYDTQALSYSKVKIQESKHYQVLCPLF